MTQNPKLLAMGLAGGYLLGRTRKAKLALAVASFVLGRRAGINPQQLLAAGLKKLSDTPEFSQLEEQIRGELMAAGKSMVTAAANRRMDSLSDALRGRTDALSARGAGADEEPEEEPAEEPAEEEEPEAEEPEEEPEAEEPEEEPEARKPPPKKAAKKAPPKKAPPGKSAEKSAPRKAAPKKAAAKKSTARKAASKQTAARKSTASGTAAQKPASRSTGRR